MPAPPVPVMALHARPDRIGRKTTGERFRFQRLRLDLELLIQHRHGRYLAAGEQAEREITGDDGWEQTVAFRLGKLG